MVEAEEDGFGVSCKRGRREYMEDRYTAGDNLRGEHKLVRKKIFFILKKKLFKGFWFGIECFLF